MQHSIHESRSPRTSSTMTRLRTLLSAVHPQLRGQLIARVRALLHDRFRRHLLQARDTMELLLQGILGDGLPADNATCPSHVVATTGLPLSSSSSSCPVHVANDLRDGLRDRLLHGVVEDREQSLREFVKHVVQEVQMRSFQMRVLLHLLADFLPQPNSPEITSSQIRTGKQLFEEVMRVLQHIVPTMPENTFQYQPFGIEETVPVLHHLSSLALEAMTYLEGAGDILPSDSEAENGPKPTPEAMRSTLPELSHATKLETQTTMLPNSEDSASSSTGPTQRPCSGQPGQPPSQLDLSLPERDKDPHRLQTTSSCAAAATRHHERLGQGQEGGTGNCTGGQGSPTGPTDEIRGDEYDSRARSRTRSMSSAPSHQGQGRHRGLFSDEIKGKGYEKGCEKGDKGKRPDEGCNKNEKVKGSATRRGSSRGKRSISDPLLDKGHSRRKDDDGPDHSEGGSILRFVK